ncbi:MAG: YmdB family metallophosphoesterase [Candidatus Doudnabacteria bacterium]|nr:YmdB family metallophosphoesterase [Candidatus Doudnabacteria bacterium]
MIKIIFFGDICGEPGRKAVRANLPGIVEAEKPDLLLANVDNLAHGKGITSKTLEELLRAGIQGFTSGNHGFSKKELSDAAFVKYKDIIARPHNIPDTYPGSGAAKFKTEKGTVLVGHFLGQVFMEKQFHDPIESPFDTFNTWLEKNKSDEVVATIVDLHAEVTSEKVAFGHFVDGKISMLLGTHTHVPTADYKVLPGGTGYITDVGMCGAANSVLGMKKEVSLVRFVQKTYAPYEIPEDASQAELSYVIIEVDETTGKASSVRGVHKIVEV